jgi:hypothetical protein
MLLWLLAALVGLLLAALQYGRAAIAPRTVPLAVLRTLAAGLVVALLVGAPAGRPRRIEPDVALDASESWLRGARGCDRWRMALDTATKLGGGHWLRFGDSVRADPSVDAPSDHASRVRPVTDRATGTGRPVIVITDGELDDPDAAAALPRGSRTIVIAPAACAPAPDVAISALEAPRALVAGDTLTARITLAAGGAGGPPGRLELRIDGALVAGAEFGPLAPYAEMPLAVRAAVPSVERAAILRAIIRGDGDLEARNDTLAIGVDVSRAPAAVFVSTSPDYDAREAVAALRGVTSLPTRAYYRVAPGAWRSDAGLMRVDESVVRAAVGEAPLVVLHGDTSAFGPPRRVTRGALLLFAPPAGDDGEWFAAVAPPSPLAAALASLPFDSLPPLSVSPAVPRGDWQGLVAHRGGIPNDRRVVLAGWDAPRHIAVLGAAGLWRWRFRGGVRMHAYGTLLGSLYDWLAAGRSDRRAVLPDGGLLRAGMPVRWRRGAGSDSVVNVTVTRRAATGRVHSLALQFAKGANVTESPPLPVGVYDVRTAGGSAVLVVNPSRELVPRRPAVKNGIVGGVAGLVSAPPLHERGWVFGVVILLLCAEWMLRRRAGLR